MTPEDIQNGTRALIGEEGRRRFAYLDSEGFWTIGVGRLIDAKKGGGLTYTEMDYLLANDMATALGGVLGRFPWAKDLDGARQFVLVSLAFQLGLEGLSAFKKMLAAVQAKDWVTAQKELLDSKLHEQTPARCERLGRQLLSGAWVFKPGT